MKFKPVQNKRIISKTPTNVLMKIISLGLVSSSVIFGIGIW
jgi:hypothetical protein